MINPWKQEDGFNSGVAKAVTTPPNPMKDAQAKKEQATAPMMMNKGQAQQQQQQAFNPQATKPNTTV